MKTRIAIARSYTTTGANPVWPIYMPQSGIITDIDFAFAATLQTAPGNGDYQALFVISTKDPTGTGITSDNVWDGVLAGVAAVFRGTGASLEQFLPMNKWAGGIRQPVKNRAPVYAYAAVSSSVRMIGIVTLWLEL